MSDSPAAPSSSAARDHLLRRIDEELAAALAAASPRATCAHVRLATGYARRLSGAAPAAGDG